MVHLYVHVPFCKRRCVYCDFAIAVRRRVPSEEFVDAVLRELEIRCDEWSTGGEPFRTIYLGGGTPSVLPPPAIGRLLRGIRETVGIEKGAEVTIEANPDDVSPAAVAVWRGSGITRVSLGAQAFHDEVLTWMHRPHTTADIERAVLAVRDTGTLALSLDLIFALPRRFGRVFEESLLRVLDLRPDHLSVYGLTVEAGTPLWRWVRRGTAQPVAETVYEAEFLEAHARLTQAGYEHYEVSNYAVPGHRSVHNAAYWSGRPYVGLGPSAHSFRAGRRRWNLRDWRPYEDAVRSGRDPLEETEDLSAEQRDLERAYLGLRTTEGLPERDLSGHRVPQLLEAGELQGWVERRGERVRLTPRGWLRLDELVPVLTTSAEGG